MRTHRLAIVAILTVGLSAIPIAVGARADLVSYAYVNEDATLLIRNKVVRLYGIHIPPTERTCRTRMTPVRCSPRAALALEFKIQGFVHCQTVFRHRDRSLTARCANDGVNLSEYLLTQGWAMALPDAPFAYHALERIARRRNLGVWGFPVDQIGRGFHRH